MEALDLSARQAGTECQPLSIEHRATWNPYQSELVWIPERCLPDRWVGGYCEPDRYIEGECISEWVPEECTGGYEDRGRYEYICRSDGSCRYEWRPRRQYIPGSCTGGYYEDFCYSDRFEPGLCYDGTFEPGWCIEGRWEYRYPGGSWSFPRYVTSEEARSCEPVWPVQRDVTAAALGVLVERLPDFVEPYWFTAAETVLSSGEEEESRAFVDAGVQVLDGILESDWEFGDGAPVPVTAGN